MSLPTVEASFRKSNQLSNQNHLRDVTNGLAHAAMGRQEKMNILPALFFLSLSVSFSPSLSTPPHSFPCSLSLVARAAVGSERRSFTANGCLIEAATVMFAVSCRPMLSPFYGELAAVSRLALKEEGFSLFLFRVFVCVWIVLLARFRITVCLFWSHVS